MFLQSFDSMSALQADMLHRGRSIGGLCTLTAYVVMLIIFTLETWNFVVPNDFETRISLDDNSDLLLQLNVDITMHKIECKNLRLMVMDSFGDEQLNTLSNDFTYRPVSSDGRQAGNAYRELSSDELKAKSDDHDRGADQELDSDWDSSHDGFKHQSFKDVVTSHDFIFVNFFASWCSHCRNFAPVWADVAKTLNTQKFIDSDGKAHHVQFIKVNCVDFGLTCEQEEIDAYPTLRLYKKDGTWSEFDGQYRDLATIESYVLHKVRESHFGFSGTSTEKFGCNVRGRLLVPRVPGVFAMEAGGSTADQGLNPARANVSHTITHLSFSDPEQGIFHRKTWRGLPTWVTDFISPMDDRSFITTTIERAPHHYVKVVSTRTASDSQIYQFVYTNREAQVKNGEVPEMRLMYDLEPMMVELSVGRKPWYDYLCSLLGIIGGIYVLIEGFVGLSRSATMKYNRVESMRSASSGSILSDH